MCSQAHVLPSFFPIPLSVNTFSGSLEMILFVYFHFFSKSEH